MEIKTYSAIRYQDKMNKTSLNNYNDWVNYESPKKFWLSPIKQVNMGQFSQNMTKRLQVDEDIN